MEKHRTGKIYKISFGPNPFGKDSLTLVKGKTMDINDGQEQIKITEIIEDHNHFFYYGKIRYVVYATNQAGLTFPFRSFIDMPCAITYEVPMSKSPIMTSEDQEKAKQAFSV